MGAAELCSAFALGGAAALLGARCSCGGPPAVKAARRSGAVLSLGISVLDYSVYLDAFPAPDTKQVATRQVAERVREMLCRAYPTPRGEKICKQICSN